jgi:integrase
MGMIYKPKYKDKAGVIRQSEVFWLKYYRNGKAYRESSKTTKEDDAKKLLRLREGEIAKGKLPGIYFEKITFAELTEDLKRDYVLNMKKSQKRLVQCLAHLERFFEGYRVPRITSDKVQAYIELRLSEDAKNATVNRELSALKRMLQLGARQTPPKVDRVPYIPMLKENNVRVGFLEHGEYLSLIEKLPEYLKPVVSFGYTYGWRHSEIIGLTWDRVDLKSRVVRLEPGTTKNDKGRTVYLDDDMLDTLKNLFSQRRLDIPQVFLRDGQPIKGFRKAWESACIEAGLCEVLRDKQGKPVVVKDRKGNEKVVKISTKLFHDLRRTAIRNLVRSGVPETVCMAISGHRTRSVFQRYDITSERDLMEATQRRNAYIQGQEQNATGKVSGKVILFQQKEANQCVG